MEKAPDAFRTISEVAEELDIPQHVLRFWESRFSQIKPMKRAGGRRYYRPDDVDLLRGIRHLLYGEGYTIRGVQRILKEQGPRVVQTLWQQAAAGAQAEAGHRVEPRVEALSPQTYDSSDDELELDSEDSELSTVSHQPKEWSREPVEAPTPTTVYLLPEEDANRLRFVLDELSECRRLLDDAMQADGMVESSVEMDANTTD